MTWGQRLQTFFRVILPHMRTALIHRQPPGFCPSFDETLITFFVIGAQMTLAPEDLGQ